MEIIEPYDFTQITQTETYREIEREVTEVEREVTYTLECAVDGGLQPTPHDEQIERESRLSLGLMLLLLRVEGREKSCAR